MTKPTAEEALEWLADKVYTLEDRGDSHVLNIFRDVPSIIGSGPTPLEAIRNAMKGESDD